MCCKILCIQLSNLWFTSPFCLYRCWWLYHVRKIWLLHSIFFSRLSFQVVDGKSMTNPGLLIHLFVQYILHYHNGQFTWPIPVDWWRIRAHVDMLRHQSPADGVSAPIGLASDPATCMLNAQFGTVSWCLYIFYWMYTMAQGNTYTFLKLIVCWLM